MLLETPDAHERRWKRYPAYRDSGVEWLGEVPENWQVERLRFHILINPTKSEVRRLAPNTTVSFIPMESVGEYGGICLDQTRPIEDVSAGYTYFQEGDVVVAKITPCFENVKRAVVKGLTNGIGFGTTELHVLRPNYNINRYFLFYLTLSYDFRKLGESEMYGSAGQKRVPEEFIKNLKHPIPPLPEQRAIAAFLDRETGRIDALIGKKERQIELLREKRTALISHAVTKGLDPDAPMKDSGVEWLGEVPERWRVKQFKRVTTRVDVGIAEAATHAYADEGVPIIRSTNVRPGKIFMDDLLHIHEWFAEKNKSKYLFANDLLTVRTGAPGTTAVIPPELHECQCFTMLISTLKTRQIPQFYSYFLNSSNARFRFAVEGWGTAQINISVPILQQQIIAEPPENEQCAITTFLDRETGHIDVLTTKVYESISKLREYRTALISAAVTGKIDVRGEET